MFTLCFPLKSTGKNVAWLPRETCSALPKGATDSEARLGKDFLALQCICLCLLQLKKKRLWNKYTVVLGEILCFLSMAGSVMGFEIVIVFI